MVDSAMSKMQKNKQLSEAAGIPYSTAEKMQKGKQPSKQPRGGLQAPGPRKPADKKMKQKGLTAKQMTLPKQLQKKIIESKKSGAGYSGSYKGN